MGFASDMRIIRAAGGSERCYSVLNGLQALEGIAAADDWVVVHDVARPCLLHSDLDKLLHTIQDPGAILAAPVRDTMKRGRQGADNSTVAGAVIDHTKTLIKRRRARRKKTTNIRKKGKKE